MRHRPDGRIDHERIRSRSAETQRPIRLLHAVLAPRTRESRRGIVIEREKDQARGVPAQSMQGARVGVLLACGGIVLVGQGVALGFGRRVTVDRAVDVPVGISGLTQVGEGKVVPVRVMAGISVLVETGVYIPVATGPPGFNRVAVGGNMLVSRE